MTRYFNTTNSTCMQTKKTLLSICALVILMPLLAQQKEGKVIYEKTAQIQFSLAGSGSGGEMTSTKKIDNFELNFANSQMVWKAIEKSIQDEAANSSEGGNFVFRMVGAGAEDILFCDLATRKKVHQREFFDKKFLINDSLSKGNWKLTEESKTILGYQCKQAITERISKRKTMTMANGKMEQKEVDDTSTVIAWFTMDIPVAAGPEMQGQLPGLILELEMNGGKMAYKAIEITPKPDMASIKEPKKGKKVTAAEFAKEQTKMIEQLQQNRTMQMRVN